MTSQSPNRILRYYNGGNVCLDCGVTLKRDDNWRLCDEANSIYRCRDCDVERLRLRRERIKAAGEIDHEPINPIEVQWAAFEDVKEKLRAYDSHIQNSAAPEPAATHTRGINWPDLALITVLAVYAVVIMTCYILKVIS